ncbi:MAG: hypothetical protein HGA49_08390 [Eubacteriaceae bacterium]|nr:hypothetical protein [Eubacteriaceae bacterium]
MSANLEIQLMFQICQKFYYKQMSKMEIAKELGISRFKVARLLDKALNEGYVKIELKDFPNTLLSLGQELEKVLNVKSVVVIDTKGLSREECAFKVQKESADFIVSILKEKDILGISCGTTLAGITRFFPSKTAFSKIQVVQITGGFHLLKNIDAFKLLADLGEKFNTEVKMFLTPIAVKSKAIKDVLLSDDSLSSGVNLFPKITIAITAIGSWHPDLTSTFYKAANLDEESIKNLQKSHVAGDIFNHLFDTEGGIIDHKINEELMTIDTQYLKRIPVKIAVSYDERKSHAILSGVKTGFIDILIIDTSTASKLLALTKQE